MYSPFWNPSCPQGGQFYACGNGTEFVGCCDNVNPCMESHGCSADDLRQTSFERSEYGKFKDQQCSYGDVSDDLAAEFHNTDQGTVLHLQNDTT